MPELKEIPVDKINLSRLLLRPIDSSKVGELAASMQSQGLLEPLKVRVAGDGYVVVYGNHRLQAARRLGWKTIQCIIEDMDDTQASLEALVENLQRNEFIDPIAEAKLLQTLIEERGWSQQKIRAQIGKSQQYVSARLSLVRLEAEIQRLITSRLVSPEHGLELSKVHDPKKRMILAKASVGTRQNPLTLKELRKMIKESKETNHSPRPTGMRRYSKRVCVCERRLGSPTGIWYTEPAGVAPRDSLLEEKAETAYRSTSLSSLHC